VAASGGDAETAASAVDWCVTAAKGAPASASLLEAYRSGHLHDLFPLRADDLEGALAVPRVVDRPALVAALGTSLARWGARPAQAAALERLRHPEARVVVTGQQIGWLLGPTYTLSKAATAVALARRLDRPERPVIPVFWMATQDHDVAEIDHAWILGRDERLHRLQLPLRGGPAVGRAVLDPTSVAAAVDHLRAIDRADGHGGPHIEAVCRLLDAACTGVARWSDAFARLLGELFGDAGLLPLDPLEPDVARLWRPQLERELADPEASAEQVRLGAARLEVRGYAAQLGRAEGASNLFVERGRGHPRELLRRDADGWRVGGERVTLAEVGAWLDHDPTAVTPAAGLRPILQDAVLPTAAFVVGPGELRYLAQLRKVYDLHGVPMPLIWPRATATVLQPPVRRILERYELDWRQLQADPQGVRAEVALRIHQHAEAFAHAAQRIEDEASSLLARVSRIDPTLQRSVQQGERHFQRTLLRLREKTAHALARRDETLRAQFQRLEQHLRPNGGLQERVLSPFSFFLTLGPTAVRDAFLALPAEGDHAIRF
jgi:bacillithiol biosynthesis cysteine-adding enzyme BshC